jgi:hypothetical protein
LTMSATVADTDRLDDDGLDRKIDQPASVIPAMYTGQGPDLLVSIQKPVPFGGIGKPANQNGFFDHVPITTTIRGDVAREHE